MGASNIRTIIADDEPLARKRLIRLLSDVPDVEIVYEAEDGKDAAAAILDHAPDLLFLDIRMPGQDGFAALEASGESSPLTVFVTAFEEYAVQAFEVEALDYLVKPVEAPRLMRTLERVRERLSGTEGGDLPQIAQMLQRIAEIGQGADGGASRAGRKPIQHLLVRDREGAQFLQVADMDWIESAGNYVTIHCGAQTHTVRRTMAELEGLLDAGSFIRTHRSHIVNLSRIRRLETAEDGSYKVLLEDGTVLPLSRTYRAALFDSMGTEF